MNQVWIKYDGSKFYTDLWKTDHDGWRTCSGHENTRIFPHSWSFELWRIFGVSIVWIRNWRDVRVNITWKNRIDRSKLRKKLSMRRILKFKRKRVNEKAKFRVRFVTYVAPYSRRRMSRKCCVQRVKSIETAITFRLRWETMSTDMVCCHASLRFRLLIKLPNGN